MITLVQLYDEWDLMYMIMLMTGISTILQEKIYSGSIHTLVTHDMPMIDENGIVRDALGHTYLFLNPPTTKQPPGRPKERRIKSQFM